MSPDDHRLLFVSPETEPWGLGLTRGSSLFWPSPRLALSKTNKLWLARDRPRRVSPTISALPDLGLGRLPAIDAFETLYNVSHDPMIEPRYDLMRQRSDHLSAHDCTGHDLTTTVPPTPVVVCTTKAYADVKVSFQTHVSTNSLGSEHDFWSIRAQVSPSINKHGSAQRL